MSATGEVLGAVDPRDAPYSQRRQRRAAAAVWRWHAWALTTLFALLLLAAGWDLATDCHGFLGSCKGWLTLLSGIALGIHAAVSSTLVGLAYLVFRTRSAWSTGAEAAVTVLMAHAISFGVVFAIARAV